MEKKITKIIGGRVFTPQGWVKDGTIVVKDGKIAEVGSANVDIASGTDGHIVETIDAQGDIAYVCLVVRLLSTLDVMMTLIHY